ncbi:hypothetical protein, partial [Klebsiella variicola]|uniref:hypothetical protein n=1 Tax=Klebsiella variicola TaxID=244366 RepID=UPI001C65C46E
DQHGHHLKADEEQKIELHEQLFHYITAYSRETCLAPQGHLLRVGESMLSISPGEARGNHRYAIKAGFMPPDNSQPGDRTVKR